MKAAARELLERVLELARGGVRAREAALGCALREAPPAAVPPPAPLRR